MADDKTRQAWRKSITLDYKDWEIVRDLLIVAIGHLKWDAQEQRRFAEDYADPEAMRRIADYESEAADAERLRAEIFQQLYI